MSKCIPLHMIVNAAAGALNETKEAVQLSIIECVVTDPELQTIVDGFRRKREWVEGWKAIGGALDRSESTASGYFRKNSYGFRSLISKGPTGKPRARRDKLELWMRGN